MTCESDDLRKASAERAARHIEDLIDEALMETFPASDPPAPAIGAERDRADPKLRAVCHLPSCS